MLLRRRAACPGAAPAASPAHPRTRPVIARGRPAAVAASAAGGGGGGGAPPAAAAVAVDAAPASALQADQPSPQRAQFDWYRAWYPVAVLRDLDRAQPHHVRLLGMDLVAWWDSNTGRWRAFQDRCPHRLAPLSEGRIDEATGQLFCNYHGWLFDGSGACTSIPQLPTGQGFSAARSCVAAFPARAAEGLLWVWADAGPGAEEASAAPDAWPGMAGDLGESLDWYARDLPLPSLAAKENAFNDPSHECVLHHGAGSLRALLRSSARPLDMQLIDMHSRGYTVREASGVLQDSSIFPCGSRRDSSLFAGIAYVVPTGPGTCRQIHAFGRSPAAASTAPPRPASGGLGRLRALLVSRRPAWMKHLESHVLLDADIATQRRVDANRGVDGRLYLPAAADAGPAACFRWLREYGGGGPPVAKLDNPFMLPAGGAPAPLDRRVLLDRFAQHTQHCKPCMAAFRWLSAARDACRWAAVVAAAAAVAVASLLAAGLAPPAAGAGGSACGSRAVLLLAGVAAVAGWLQVQLRRLVQAFVFVDYDAEHVSKRA